MTIRTINCPPQYMPYTPVPGPILVSSHGDSWAEERFRPDAGYPGAGSLL